jgi:hypothetical protein
MEPPRPSRDPRALARACAILAALWLFVFTPQILRHKTFVRGDARIYQPYSELSRERWLRLHQRTFWNPYVLTGVSAQASLADMRPQYLPDLALDLFERIRPSHWVPMAGPITAHLAGLCGMAALAWCLWGLPTVALVWAGLAWGLSPIVMVPIAYGHTAYSVAVWLMPPLLVAAHEVVAAPTRLRMFAAALALALLSGLQALNGHPQVVAYSGAVALGFAIERGLRHRHPARIAVAVAGLAWGAAIAAAVWLPALRYGGHSARAVFGLPLAQVRGMSIAWRELASFALPQAVGGLAETYWGGLGTTDYPRFFGTLVVGLAVVGWAAGGGRRRDGRAFLAGLCAIAVALALGPRLAPLYELVSRIPVLERFRVASMVLVIVARRWRCSRRAGSPAGSRRIGRGGRAPHGSCPAQCSRSACSSGSRRAHTGMRRSQPACAPTLRPIWRCARHGRRRWISPCARCWWQPRCCCSLPGRGCARRRHC